ncbi:gram-negative bacteria-binding protein 1 [Musca domestica]|uniref:Gram-negative bacteria-binding protein 1 n=1 Tax=Musca domestica TaxID=7370 RepID=A0A9J7I6S5_MUSDO|nr:gram-negative bacteria-binding protein 1 [Musca domestica]
MYASCKMRSLQLFIGVVLLLNRVRFNYGYTVETVKLEVFNDKFRASIPNDPDIKWVAFNVNINKAFSSFEAGQLSGLVGMPKNGKWTHEFRRSLSDSDVIYIWLAMQYDGVIFRDRQGPFSVAAIRNGDPNIMAITTSSTTTTPTTTTTTPVPSPSSGDENRVNNTQNCFDSQTELPHGDNKHKHCKGDLLFEENFDNLDDSRWINEVRIPIRTTDDEFVFYNGTAYVDNGILKITPTLYNGAVNRDYVNLGNRCTARYDKCSLQGRPNYYIPPIVSGRINSRNSFNFKYGRIEVKAKMPKGDWLVPLLLLEPNAMKYGNAAYKSGEMRIAFVRGNKELKWRDLEIDGSHLYGGVIVKREAERRHDFMANVTLDDVNGSKEHFGNTFHVYSLIWKPTELLLFVDGYQYGRIATDFKKSIREQVWDLGGDNAPLDDMFYITLGLSAGGHGDFPHGIPNKPWVNTNPKAPLHFSEQRNAWHSSWEQPSLEVDYVRVYAI